MLNQKWTIDEDNRLLELKLANKLWAVIAKQLNRTETAVISRFGVLKHRNTTDHVDDSQQVHSARDA